MFPIYDGRARHFAAVRGGETHKNLYRNHYSASRLRDLAGRKRHYDHHTDLWEGLTIIFDSLAAGQPSLALPALGGVFAKNQCPDLDAARISNRNLLEAIYSLSFFRSGDTLARINYRDMDTEELGSVYESLLELMPSLDLESPTWSFHFAGDKQENSARGNARKLTGSYYTPDSLVQELIKSALAPVIERALTEHPENPRAALLKLKIVDPAASSGHFLLAAARRWAAEVARIDAGIDQATEKDYRHALREVVSHCIYGVDLNPLAVELCKTALWLESVETGKPLGFLDAHIQCGNSLVGILDPEIMQHGIPDEAFKALTGDDPKAARQLKQRNRDTLEDIQHSIFEKDFLAHPGTCAANLDSMPEDTLEQIAQKKQAWEIVQTSAACMQQHTLADLYRAAFFARKTLTNHDAVPINEDLRRVRHGLNLRSAVIQPAGELAKRHRFFHWHIAFSEIFDQGGFDVALGNPPWEVSQLSETEYFEGLAPRIASLKGNERKTAIAALIETEPGLWQQYQNEKHTYECINSFFRNSMRYPLSAIGKLNLYALFAELFLNLANKEGRAGFIAPTGIANDDSTKTLFESILTNNRLSSLYDFENRE